VADVVLGLLYLLVLGWSSVGIGLLVTFGRSASTLVFRLAAAFLAVWAFVATTGLVWVVANGGWRGAVQLWNAPLTIFDPRFALLWLAGAIGTFLIFLTAFLLSQGVGRGYLAVRRPRSLDWPARLPRPARPTDLFAYPSARAEAFAFTLIEPGGRHLLRRRDVVLLSDGLLAELTAEERDVVIAHELGHLRELDGRYLTFFRTLARLVRWDPILAYLADRLTEREEFRADLDAVALTGRPRTLARALYKAASLPDEVRGPMPGLLGPGGRRGRRQALERIRRLVSLAESGRFPEEPGA
jgi:Zn-dependent protease with chaperone function